jgi:hypothetical protein
MMLTTRTKMMMKRGNKDVDDAASSLSVVCDELPARGVSISISFVTMAGGDVFKGGVAGCSWVRSNLTASLHSRPSIQLQNNIQIDSAIRLYDISGNNRIRDRGGSHPPCMAVWLYGFMACSLPSHTNKMPSCTCTSRCHP